jgi:hypothetical protein
MSITIGAEAKSRATGWDYEWVSRVQRDYQATATGKLTKFQVYLNSVANNGTNFLIGTFTLNSATSVTMRDYENLGTVVKGSLQTFTGKDCDVVTGDVLGSYSSGSWCRIMVDSGVGSQADKSGNIFTGSLVTGLFGRSATMSTYGEGDAPSPNLPAVGQIYQKFLAH